MFWVFVINRLCVLGFSDTHTHTHTHTHTRVQHAWWSSVCERTIPWRCQRMPWFRLCANKPWWAGGFRHTHTHTHTHTSSMHGGLLYANVLVLYHEDANACHGLDYVRTSHGGQAVSDTHTHTHVHVQHAWWSSVCGRTIPWRCKRMPWFRLCANMRKPWVSVLTYRAPYWLIRLRIDL